MRIKEIMTRQPVCCFPSTLIENAASLMVEHDCGALPVVAVDGSRVPVGIITDRDIVCRMVARADSPVGRLVVDCMSGPPICVSLNDSVSKARTLMQEYKVRRILVLDETGGCCGILAQADLARQLPNEATAELLRSVSRI